eukprot:8993880-Alexandrium_andersonii.AAC.1
MRRRSSGDHLAGGGLPRGVSAPGDPAQVRPSEGDPARAEGGPCRGAPPLLSRVGRGQGILRRARASQGPGPLG